MVGREGPWASNAEEGHHGPAPAKVRQWDRTGVCPSPRGGAELEMGCRRRWETRQGRQREGWGAQATATPDSWVLVLLWMLGDPEGGHAAGRGMFIHQPLQSQGEGCSQGSWTPLPLPQPHGPRQAQRERPAAAVCGEAVHTVSQAGRRDVTPGTPHAWGSLGLGPGSLTGEEGHAAACVRTHTTTCPGDTRNQLK